MEIVSSQVKTTLGENSTAIITAIIVFFLLKNIESVITNIILIGKSGKLTPKIWARSILISEAWDPFALFRLIARRSRYDVRGGKRRIVNHPSAINVCLLVLFLLLCTAAEVILLYGSLSVERDVDISSIKLRFKHSGKAGSSDAISSKGCAWANATGSNFQLTAPVGVCWADGDGDNDGFIVGINNGTSQFTIRKYESALFIEVLTPNGFFVSGGSTDLKTNAHLAGVIVSSSGVVSRVQMDSSVVDVVKTIIRTEAEKRGCQFVLPRDNDNQAIASRGAIEIKWCNAGIEPFTTADKLIAFASGGFQLENGGPVPWSGNIRSSRGENQAVGKIGVINESRLSWQVLLYLLIGFIVAYLASTFLPGDDQDVAMKIVMERTGENLSAEDPTGCVGNAIEVVAATRKEGDTVIGRIGTTVPPGYSPVESLEGILVE